MCLMPIPAGTGFGRVRREIPLRDSVMDYRGLKLIESFGPFYIVEEEYHERTGTV